MSYSLAELDEEQLEAYEVLYEQMKKDSSDLTSADLKNVFPIFPLVFEKLIEEHEELEAALEIVRQRKEKT